MIIKKTSIALLALTFAIGVVACKKEGPAEKAGEKIDNAAESLGEEIEEATE